MGMDTNENGATPAPGTFLYHLSEKEATLIEIVREFDPECLAEDFEKLWMVLNFGKNETGPSELQEELLSLYTLMQVFDNQLEKVKSRYLIPSIKKNASN